MGERGRGVVEGWLRGGRGVGLLPPSIMYTYISHVKMFTSKMTEEGETSGSVFLVSYFCDVCVKHFFKNALILTTSTIH